MKYLLYTRQIIAGLLIMFLLLPASYALGQDNWTFMVYLDGDNNLEPAGINDFEEMASVGSNANINILVLFDRITGFDTSNDNWTTTKRGIVNPGDSPDDNWGTDMGELDMGDPQTLIDFVDWGITNFPADRYAIIIWDHGSGWREYQREDPKIFKSVCSDDTNGTILNMSDVRSALAQIASNYGQIDLIGFDACLMAMIEVAYEIRNFGNIMVGSEKLEPGDGWPYNDILQEMVDYPEMAPAYLGGIIVQKYYDFYEDETQSSIYLQYYGWLDGLVSNVDILSQILIDEWNDDYVQCLDYAHRVRQWVGAAVSAELHGDDYAGSNGLAIYFPKITDFLNTQYSGANILFALDTRWDEFQARFRADMNNSWVETARLNCLEYESEGTSRTHVDLSNFCYHLIENTPGNTIWVNYDYMYPYHTGSYTFPYDNLVSAVSDAAGDGSESVCIISTSIPEIITIDKKVTLRAIDGTVTIGE